MSETKSIKVRFVNGTIEECAVLVAVGQPWKLFFSGIGWGVQEFAGADLFESMNALRRMLEGARVQLLCAGARPDVFPSEKSRSLAGGRRAYVTRMGAPALRADLVDIFGYAEPALVGTMSQQEAFHRKWTASVRG